MSLDKLLEFSSAKPKKSPCKGLVFRGAVNQFFTGTRFVFSQELRLLKRKSCSGCIQCGPLLDDFHEFAINRRGLILPDIQHGKLYSLRVTNVSTDWETGYVDDWDLEVYELKPDDNNESV